MEREIWLRLGMFSTIVVLVALILVTPGLMGRQTTLASLPVLIVAMNPDLSVLVVDVAGGLQPYLYANVSLEATAYGPGNSILFQHVARANWTFGAELYLAANGTTGLPLNGTPFLVHVRLVDRDGNLFEDNVTVRSYRNANGEPVLSFGFPDDPGTASVTRTPPGDFRWAVPRKGSVPGTA